MRLIFTLILLILTSGLVQAQPMTAIADHQNRNASYQSKSAAAFKELHSENWYTLARQKIREQEYHIKWKTGLQEFVTVNRKNQVGFYFRPDGYRVIAFSSSQQEKDNWEFNFRFGGIQRGAHQFTTSSSVKIKQNGNQLVYQYPQYAIEYLNDTSGMRQNFIINKRLSGHGLLEIAIGLQGDLQTSVANNRQLILSSNNNGSLDTKLRYDQLKVWDRNHQLLDASMELIDEGKTLIISVDDTHAAYPVTIDPLNHTPNWTDNGQGVLPSLDVLYGSTVSDAGDVNNDGFDDIIIGAPANIDVLSSTVIASTGQAFIYLGSATGPSTTPDITLQSSSAINALFGFSVSSAGDINNDGFDDVIVGAPGDQVTLNFGIPFGSISNDIGKAYVYFGNATPATVPGSVVSLNFKATDFLGASFGVTLNPLYGYSVNGAGDVNNDGFDDVIIGSPVYTDLGTLAVAGRATIYLGSAGGLNTINPIHRNGGLLANTLFGFSVNSAGDMNNDGADEVLIGAPGALSLLPGIAGKVYVYPGISLPTSGSISSSPITYSDGSLLKTLFGFSVSNAGDVNNDGYDDIVVGQPATLSLSGLVTVGKASIFFGNGTLSNKTSSDVTLNSPRDPDILGLVSGNLLFGFSVSGGKDLNCDGISDVIVGEPGGTSLSGLSGINASGGQAYIYYGRNATGPASNPGWDLKETGALTVANLLGYSVSMAGDVNGDGKNEILIGAANGTLDLTNVLTGLINFVFVQSVGSAYLYNGCIIPTLFTLPVSLISFNGHLRNSSVVLKWQTASEQISDHFEVERHVNGTFYEKIGEVMAKGESRATVDYSFIDDRPLPGNNIYRLKMVDRDGKFTYSYVVTINIQKTVFIRVRSSLVNTAFTLEFNNVSKGDYSIDLISMDGRVLQSNIVKISSDYTTHTINVKNNAAKGMYIVNVQKKGSAERYREQIIIH
ncbi:MAG TPA: hypothetical protein VJU78_01485 [Chitinophagaceae bacterium]|nr:hypothetical protein [Chitinophagaceae bacterium]